MSLIPWEFKTFSVNHPDMDEQHRKWISIINNLHDTLVDKNAKIDPREILSAMLDYAHMHFSAEEDLMLSINYPNYKLHKSAHESFIGKLQRMQYDLNRGELISGPQLMTILQNWLVDHIINMDKHYSSYLSTK